METDRQRIEAIARKKFRELKAEETCQFKDEDYELVLKIPDSALSLPDIEERVIRQIAELMGVDNHK